MKKIYAIIPNPALDLSGHVSKIIANEKNYVHHARVDVGGNSVNAARIAKRLGAKPLLLGFVGGPAGAQFETLLDFERLSHDFTHIAGSTRTNVTVTNDEDFQQTRLTFPGPKMSAQELRDLREKIKKLQKPGVVILGGSLPQGSSHDLYFKLIRDSQARGLAVIVDAPAPEMKTILRANLKKLFMIKPNRVEFEWIVGKKLKSNQEIAAHAVRLLSRCECVCVSLGAKGAIVAWNKRAWWIASPKIRAVGTVGAGDSLVGAVAARWASHDQALDERAVLDAFRFGVAAGAATAMTEGTSLGKARLIKRLFKRTSVKKIIG